MRYVLFALLALTAARAVAVEVAHTAQSVLEQVNRFRKAEGLQPVSADPALEQTARDFAQFMAKTGKYGHTADGREPHERAQAHGYDLCIVSENIAMQYRSSGFASAAALAEGFVSGWKDSPEHRKNMMDAAVTETGVGVAQGDGGRYFAVQMFGRPKSEAIRFSVSNRSGAQITYRAAGRAFSLPTNATRTHVVCRPTELELRERGYSDKVAAGARYRVLPKRVVREPSAASQE